MPCAFFDTSTAGSAAITNNGVLTSHDSSEAGSATITNNAPSAILRHQHGRQRHHHQQRRRLQFFDSSTAGSATITSNGTVQFFANSNAGIASINNGGGGGVVLFSDTSTAGNATITINNGAGGLQFSGNSTAGGATITSNGIVQFLDTSTAGSATITNNGAGVLQFGDTSTAGSATITNNSGMEFVGTSTAGSATITNNAVLQFFNTSTAGTATITNTGVLQFVDTSTAGSAAITNNNVNTGMAFRHTSTAGNATITNNGVLDFHETSTAGSATITNNDRLIFREASTAGSAAIANNAFLQFSNTSTAGTATITNTGVLQFVDTSTAGSAAITNNNFCNSATPARPAAPPSPTTAFCNSTTPARPAAPPSPTTSALCNSSTTARPAAPPSPTTLICDSSTPARPAAPPSPTTVVWDSSTPARPAAPPSPTTASFFSRSLARAARRASSTVRRGTIDLSGLTSAGMTAGSIEGAGTIFLGAKNLAVGGNNLSTTFSGVLQDGGVGGGVGGSLTKTGTGTLTLSGTSTYTGATTVDAGTLLVNGSIVSSILTTVNAGGTLGGNGTVGNTVIDGGTLAAGNSIGTLTVSGSLVMTAASTYLVEVSPTNADRTDVTGTATLGGTVQAVFAPGSYVTRSYTILSATGGLGGTTFSGLTIVPAGFTADLSYTSTDVLLNLTAALGTGGALNQNQRNVANALNGFFNNGGALPPGFVNVFGLTGGNLAHTLSLLSGEAATGARQGAFQLGGQFLGLMLDPFVDGRGGIAVAGGPALGFAPEREALPDGLALAYAKVTKAPPYNGRAAAFEQRWTAWGGAFGGYNRTGGDPAVIGSHDLTARTAGVAAGLDYHFSRDAVFGFALAGGGTNWSLADGLGGGKSDAFQAGVYAAARSGPAYLAASLAFAHHWMSTDRNAAFGNHLTAGFNAQSIGARVESGYRVGTPAGAITPYGALQAQSFHTPAYSETDVNGGGFGLTYNVSTAHDIRGELGARFDHVALVDPTAVLTLRGRLAWAHDWVSDPSLAAVFQALPGASFIVTGATPAKDSALASAGAELKLANGVTLIGKLDGELASRAQTYTGTGTVRWAW